MDFTQFEVLLTFFNPALMLRMIRKMKLQLNPHFLPYQTHLLRRLFQHSRIKNSLTQKNQQIRPHHAQQQPINNPHPRKKEEKRPSTQHNTIPQRPQHPDLLPSLRILQKRNVVIDQLSVDVLVCEHGLDVLVDLGGFELQFSLSEAVV